MTPAATLAPAAVGTHVDIDFTPAPGIRNNWDPQPVRVSGNLDAVRVYEHGTVRVVVDGRPVNLPGGAPVRVAPHVRVPDTAAAAAPAPERATTARTAEQVRAGNPGTRLAVGELTTEHYGATVEFDFRGARFFGTLTSVTSAFSMFSVTLDGSEKFLFDDDQSLIVCVPEVTERPAAPTPTVAAPAVAAPLMAVPEYAPAPVVSAAPAVQSAAWVPVPADELEFV